MANCRLIRTPPSALAEGAKNTFDYGGFAKPILPKNAHHITTSPNGLPKVIDTGLTETDGPEGPEVPCHTIILMD